MDMMLAVTQELAQLRVSYNELLEIVGQLATDLAAAANVAAVNTAGSTAETDLEAKTKKVVGKPSIPLSPAFPVL